MDDTAAESTGAGSTGPRLAAVGVATHGCLWQRLRARMSGLRHSRPQLGTAQMTFLAGATSAADLGRHGGGRVQQVLHGPHVPVLDQRCGRVAGLAAEVIYHSQA